MVRFVAVYALLFLAAAALFGGVAHLGASLNATMPIGAEPFGKSAGGDQLDLLLHVLLALLVIIGAARVVGRAGRWIGQRAVVGEIVAGLLLGPSLLGRIAPHVAAFVLPPAVAPLVQVLAQVGVILFMFLVGVELDPEALRSRGRAAIGISHASMVVPFCFGALLALHLSPRLATADVPFVSFALFLGISMSVTAFPVLARILEERGLDTRPVGARALTCAAVDDVTAWCLLAFVVGVVRSKLSGALLTLLLAVGYIALVLLVLRPVLARISGRVEARRALSRPELAWVVLLVLGSALATDAIGIHALFGAFAVACALIFVVACVGKMGGSSIAARATGLSWREAGTIGVLVNTRGLMELVVLNIGRDLHIITPALFAMLVLMAVATTLMTAPLIALTERGARRTLDPLAAQT